ncbi:MAG: SH3 domain-containing protein, partial [Caldilineae bacterium]
MARLQVTGDVANVRQGPGTNYPVIGSVNQGMAFDISGKNPAGDWYQFCCVNGETGWIFGQLVRVEHPELVAVAQNIPAPPPTATPPPPPPTNTPAPPPVADPCANIGGDGCKFKVTGGPRYGDNGGLELKLQLFFIHSGVDGGQPQGSYFLALEKDGQRLPIPDSVRSIALQRSEGPLGPYNYEYKLGVNQLPGNTVAGN